MPQPPDATDFRRADDSALLQALVEGQPLALAEAYHRSVPAAHAVARRLVGGVSDVESLLLTVYAQLWDDPPTDGGPLEGWVRRTTWTRGAERLRAQQMAPASPSSAGLLPDLPAPDVRFLDAAERAIAELPDDARRALLLAHDKGVPSDAQDPGAGLALTAALLALAGPETSGADRDAISDDGCDDVPTMGDWCLGLLAPASQSVVAEAIDQRSGCAATSRAVRRGRRRIEGLPATPDMGQRILVTVLTGAGRPAAVTPSPAPPAEPAPEEMSASRDETVGPEDTERAAGGPAAVDPFAPVGDPATHGDADAAAMHGDEAFTDVDEEVIEDAEIQADPLVVDTADMPQSDVEDSSPSGSWLPGPGDSTAELRLSDILSDEGEEDDPFADLDDAEPAADTTPSDAQRSPRDPYSALRGLEEDEGPLTPQGPVSPAFASPQTAPQPSAPEDEALVGDYIEGQEADYLDHGAPSRLAGVLAWILPILGGSALGILVAIQIFGLP